MNLICECKSNTFNIASNYRFAKCTACGQIYNNKGEKVEVSSNQYYTQEVNTQKE